MTWAHFKFFNYPISFLAIISPWWMPVLEEASKYSAMLLPVAGLAFLGLQMVLAILTHRRKRGG